MHRKLKLWSITCVFGIWLCGVQSFKEIISLQVEEVAADRIIKKFEDLSATQCQIRCNMEKKCVAIATSKNLKIGMTGLCYLLQEEKVKKSMKGDAGTISGMMVGKKSACPAKGFTGDRCGEVGESICKKYETAGSTCLIKGDEVGLSFSHNREVATLSSGHEFQFDNVSIIYVSNIDFIKSVVAESSGCIQRFKIVASGVYAHDVKIVTGDGTMLGMKDADCHNCRSALKNQPTPKSAHAYITNSALLPLRGILIRDTGSDNEWVEVTFEKLTCTKRF